MALTRHWYPTGNKSSRSADGRRLLVIHTTEGFTGSNGMYDCAQYFQGPVGTSSHVVIDNFHPGHICECVTPDYSSWTQCNYNAATWASVEQCGYASWSRDTWLNDKMPLLENTAAWLAEESARSGIPLTDLTSSAAQGSGRGVCYHMDLGPSGCGHSDPGSGYPLDVVLEMARGGAPSQPPGKPPEDEDDMPYLHVPPKSVSARSIHMSLDGMFSTLGLGVDASGAGNVNIRAAFHKGNNVWRHANVYGDPGHNKVVYVPKDGDPPVAFKFDAVRIDRVDDTDIDLVINFGK
jgi:hypothetical protein